MKQTVILALYLNIGNMSPMDANEYCDQATKTLNRNNENFEDIHVQHYIIPIREGESRVECVYPSIVADENLKDTYSQTIEKLNKYLDLSIDSNNFIKE